ncbi:MAG: hypothetical protein A2X64_07685 [Ignavibacteria bacterium GWF2_33_9]|nr:MAG: hypothetical protein A2X64_07685 [Ignavibacteria bacterium GWF2_33_9]
MKIKISTIIKKEHLIKQLPDLKLLWDDCEFFINDPINECDWWVVYEGIDQPETVRCPHTNLIFITAEPPSIKTYDNKFLQQFSHIITCHQDITHNGKVLCQQGLPWRVGTKFTPGKDAVVEKSYDDLKDATFEKTKLISVVCSNKTFTEGHRTRYDFVMKLKKHFGDKIDLYGEGFSPIPDKLDALAEYKYHIAIENFSIDDYWTEKLADPFITETYPFYYGCRNIERYFPDGSYTYIDIYDLNKSVNIIENIIKNNTFEKAHSKIKEAKNLVMDKYNFFALIAEFSKNNKVENQNIKTIIIKPENYYQTLNQKKFFRKIEIKTKDVFKKLIFKKGVK